MRWVGQVVQMGGKYRVLVGSNSPLGRTRCGWVDNIKVDLQDVG